VARYDKFVFISVSDVDRPKSILFNCGMPGMIIATWTTRTKSNYGMPSMTTVCLVAMECPA